MFFVNVSADHMKRSSLLKKDASETENLQNTDQANDAAWGRNVGYDEATRKTN